VRFVIIGAGAVGGTVGVGMHLGGQSVVLLARGAHYEAIAERGLTLETPRDTNTVRVPVVREPREIEFGADDVVLLTTKSQDTQAALDALALAAGPDVPVVCAQNGVENERVALRRFTNVYGAVVMAPTAHLEPGVVQAYGAAQPGQIDVGCYPEGTDELCGQICEALRTARFSSAPREDVMRYKHAKLLANLGNAVQAVCGSGAASDELVDRARAEGREVLSRAGIAFEADEVADVGGRWDRWEVAEIGGRPRSGGSTWQSIARGAGTVETDYLNGEIALHGRLVGVPTPVNTLLQALASETVRDGHQPGWLPADEVLRRLPGHSQVHGS
jgi:2-dehydropantoate 2-reductase